MTIFCHFGPFFALLPHYWPWKLKFGKNLKNPWRYYSITYVYHKWRSYDIWFLKYKAQGIEFFLSFLAIFCPLPLPITQKIKILKKMKKVPGDIIIFNLCTINEHYDVWFLRYGLRQTKFFFILNDFLLLYSPNNPESQNFEKVKKMPGDITISLMCTLNENYMMHVSWDMEHYRQNFFVTLDHFCPFTPPPPHP